MGDVIGALGLLISRLLALRQRRRMQNRVGKVIGALSLLPRYLLGYVGW